MRRRERRGDTWERDEETLMMEGAVRKAIVESEMKNGADAEEGKIWNKINDLTM